MTTLVLQLPTRPRLDGEGAAPAPNPSPGSAASGFDWWLLADDGQLRDEGRAAADALPPSEQLVLLLPDALLSWHRVTLPRTGSQRWRAALVGLLEEQLLEDPETLHLALEPQAAGGADCWVAATPKAPLQDAIAQLEAAQRFVDRVLPAAWPEDTPSGHVQLDDAGRPQLLLRDAQGVVSLPLRGGFAQLLKSGREGMTWTASAEALDAAEHWLGQRVAVLSPAQRAAQALRSRWDLRQFDLAPRLHGLRWLRQAGQQLLHPQWSAARKGLLLWLLLALVGLNLAAWQQRKLVAERQQQITATLKTAFPRIGYVLEPALQMQRELAQLRAQAGALGDQDFEALVAALAQAWPMERGPVEALQFEPGQLSLPRAGFSDAQIEQLRRQLASEGWLLLDEQGKLALKRKT